MDRLLDYPDYTGTFEEVENRCLEELKQARI